ncbi:MAG: DMT family transporter [Hyphomicrobiaceae bacterium]
MSELARVPADGLSHRHSTGVLLVAGAALLWSTGGLVVRSLETTDSWTIVFWRSATASAFLLLYLLARYGRDAIGLFRQMGLPGVIVGLCYTSASIALIVALSFTSVANALVIMSCAPLLSALLGRAALGERVGWLSWLAILASAGGITLMVSGSFGHDSIVGDLAAFSIAIAQAIAVVTMRKHRQIRMLPAMLLATSLATVIALPLAGTLAVSLSDLALLTFFGAGQLGLGLAMFSVGAPLIPAAQAALLNVIEPVLGPLWVWLALGERPSDAAILGGTVVLVALAVHTLVGFTHKR